MVLMVCSIPLILSAQEKWDLRKCVDYAMQNNISVKQADVQARLSVLQSKLSRAQQIPTLGFNTGAGYQFGRNIDPTSNQFTNTRVFFQSYGLQTGVTLFNWFNVRNAVKSAVTNEEASKLDVNRAQNDVALNVAAAYLQLLLSIEQVNIARTQINLTDSQLMITRKLVDAGSMPELNAAQLESQMATDSSTLITNISTMQQNRLQLMALLNLDAATDFDVSLPDLEKIPLPQMSELEPESVYKVAVGNQLQQRVNDLKIKAAEYNVKSARGAMYPTLSAFASMNSNYGSTYQQFAGASATGKFDTLGVVPVGATNYYAITPQINVTTKNVPYFKQIGDVNLNQSIGLQLNVPIFNGRQLRTNYERAKIDVDNLKLQQELANQTLQQNIYNAYNTSISALQTFEANKKATDYAQYAFDLSKKRYDIGMLSTIDFITTQNALNRAKINQAASRYDYIFRLKVLEFYKEGTIRL